MNNRKQITRRRFLTLAGVAVGSCALSCAGFGVLMNREDLPETSMTLGSPELTFGESRMTKKILVAYATAAGSTGGVAEMIGKTLAESSGQQTAVDVRPVQSVTNLEDYSAVHGRKWLPEAVAFLQNNIAYCGLGIRGGDFRDPVAIRAWAESVRPLLVG